jgi:hypothetical protein
MIDGSAMGADGRGDFESEFHLGQRLPALSMGTVRMTALHSLIEPTAIRSGTVRIYG